MTNLQTSKLAQDIRRHVRLTTAAAMAFAGLAGTAMADEGVPAAASSIEIYGLLDIGIESVNNGAGAKTSLTSGLADGSRLGFKGSEDLGGGWKAIFTLAPGEPPGTRHGWHHQPQ